MPPQEERSVPPAAGGCPKSERLTRDERLRRRREYLRCYRQGRRRHGSLAVLYFVPNGLRHPRIGITASRKVGKSVARQRLKRRIKEIYRRCKERPRLPPMDLVVHLKPAAANAGYRELEVELLRLLRGLPRQRPVEAG